MPSIEEGQTIQWVNEKRTKGKTMIYNTYWFLAQRSLAIGLQLDPYHRTPKMEQRDSYLKPEIKLSAPEGLAVPALQI